MHGTALGCKGRPGTALHDPVRRGGGAGGLYTDSFPYVTAFAVEPGGGSDVRLCAYAAGHPQGGRRSVKTGGASDFAGCGGTFAGSGKGKAA
ncbi:hypothetical protein IMSAG025_00482 [Muribaculaceae bacterium]|nr:hypothetical protein IMSAG025_00482 [Muribaculaceae bacterium]